MHDLHGLLPLRCARSPTVHQRRHAPGLSTLALLTTGTILDLPYCLSSELSGPLYPPNDNTGTIYCVSAALDEQCAYETAEGGVCTRAFLGSYRPGQSPGQILRNMRAYATKKGMPQTIAM